MADTPYTILSSPLGRLLVTSDGTHVTRLSIEPADGSGFDVPASWTASVGTASDVPFDDVRAQVDAYFSGTRRTFDVPLAPGGTAFQRAVWDALQTIPYGQRISYGDVARRIGQPSAAQAVGAANGKNPIALLIPCHRVVGADGSLTGYAGGLDRKRWLLRHEARRTGLFAV